MQPCDDLIKEARRLLLTALQQYILNKALHLQGCYLRVIFTNGTRLYITYNSYQEYSCQFLYSMQKDDRERFDNYDKEWNVRTQPHHFHARGTQDVQESPMKGEPQHDIPILIKFLEKRLNINQSFHFE